VRVDSPGREAHGWDGSRLAIGGHSAGGGLAAGVCLTAKDLSGLPPALVITAEFDTLRNEGDAFPGTASSASVRSRWSLSDGPTGFPIRVTRYRGVLQCAGSAANAVSWPLRGRVPVRTAKPKHSPCFTPVVL
jgi:acetyl esterase/lipase